MIPWILIAVLIVLIIFGVLTFLLLRKKKRPVDYYSLFIIGVIWFIFGIASGNSMFWIMGLAFMVIGLINKDKWEKNRRRWDKMDKDEKRLMIIIMVILGLLVLAGLIFLLLVNKGII